MTQQPIVHIGYHKTATTWFQERFYPHVTSHRFVSPQLVRESLLNPHAFGFDPEVAREALNAADKRPPILCDENLSGGFRTGGMMGALSKEVAERIYRVLPDAQVVLFIRHQVDMAAAIYAQYLKRGVLTGRDVIFSLPDITLRPAGALSSAPFFRSIISTIGNWCATIRACLGRIMSVCSPTRTSVMSPRLL